MRETAAKDRSKGLQARYGVPKKFKFRPGKTRGSTPVCKDRPAVWLSEVLALRTAVCPNPLPAAHIQQRSEACVLSPSTNGSKGSEMSMAEDKTEGPWRKGRAPPKPPAKWRKPLQILKRNHHSKCRAVCVFL